jgi:uncharacterized protein (DUF885 family)
MLFNKYAPLNDRLLNFEKRLRYVDAYYAAAIRNLRNPEREHTLLAIEQNTGGMSVFGDDLKSALDSCTLGEAQKNAIRQKAGDALKAIRSFTEALSVRHDQNPRPFNLGKALYIEKFRHDIQSDEGAEEIYRKAVARKEFLHARMEEITKKLWTRYFPRKEIPAPLIAIRALIDTLSVNHVARDSFQSAIEKQIPQLEKFVTRKKLLYLDPSKPLVVRREPAYMAGIAGASINSPGPYDKKGNTYYNVGSLAGWSNERAESYLREYNRWILQILNIHEAVPGHYTQLVYSNNSPSLVKTILGNGAMVEGWAVYTEQMMLENGYGAGPGDSTAPDEMWLMYYKWNLRTVCNTILDHDVHVNGMDRDHALRLLNDEAFQQKAEAEGKWRRVTLTQVQLCSYFTGFSEIVALRDELRQKWGSRFDLPTFHEKFLSYGSAPVKYIRRMMLEEIPVK